MANAANSESSDPSSIALYTFGLGAMLKQDCVRTYPSAQPAIEASWQQWSLAKPAAVARFHGETVEQNLPQGAAAEKQIGHPGMALTLFWCTRLNLYLDYGISSNPTAAKLLAPFTGQIDTAAISTADAECKKQTSPACPALDGKSS
ncbi:hypothetical protein [Silvimonas soli]|uniref:hypothetical protein n=1 Tax=Silvimonas soli TaxID=2980100 RepID=UPI0024B35120|nr:hypothetical protein [Silvimonas soli]